MMQNKAQKQNNTSSMFQFEAHDFLSGASQKKENTLTTTLSNSALKRLRELLATEKEGSVFRVRVSSGGCAGMQYHFSFDHLQQEDLTQPYDDVVLAVDPLSASYLKESEVDYITHLSGAYFTVKNPQAKSSCGCGSSFSI